MNIKSLANLVTSKAGRQVLIAQKHSPAILFGAGVVGIVTTVVLASRATLRLEDVLDDADDDLEKIQVTHGTHVNYTDMDKRADTIKVYIRTGARIVVLYGPAVIVGLASIAALTGSHVVLTRRNVSLTAAYAGLDKAYRAYREKVIQEYGPDADTKLRYDVEEYTIVEETDKGPVTKKAKRVKGAHGSPYAMCFGQTNRNWNPEHMYNQFFLECQQSYANDLLRARGHVFLNEVYTSLGFDHTPAGAVTGWLMDSPDKYISFGIFEGDVDAGLQFVRGEENAIWLDFNVDGVIYDKI